MSFRFQPVELFKNIRKTIDRTEIHGDLNSDDKARLQLYTVFLLMTTSVLGLFIVYSAMNGNFMILLFQILLMFVLIASVGLLHRPRITPYVYRINAGFFAMFIFYLVLFGQGPSTILWLYVFPLCVFFLFNKNEGLIWSSVVLSLALTSIWLGQRYQLANAYPRIFMARFVCTYIFVSIVACWLAFYREKYRDSMIVKHNRLKYQQIELHTQMEALCRIRDEKEHLIAQLTAALEQVKTLKGFIPLCCHCKKIRDDEGYWSSIEAYIKSHSEAEFTHSMCPECATKLYPDFYRSDESQ
jgi:hypothetical protein